MHLCRKRNIVPSAVGTYIHKWVKLLWIQSSKPTANGLDKGKALYFFRRCILRITSVHVTGGRLDFDSLLHIACLSTDDGFIHLFVHTSIHLPFVQSFTHLVMRSIVHSLIHLLFRPFVHSLIHLFTSNRFHSRYKASSFEGRSWIVTSPVNSFFV